MLTLASLSFLIGLLVVFFSALLLLLSLCLPRWDCSPWKVVFAFFDHEAISGVAGNGRAHGRQPSSKDSSGAESPEAKTLNIA